MTDRQLLPILEFTATGIQACELCVIRETGLHIAVNGRPLVRLACTGKCPEYLTAGFLFSCGVINAAADIIDLRVSERDDELYASVTVNSTFSLPQQTVTSGLGRSFQPQVADLDPLPAPSAPLWTLPRIQELSVELNNRCDLYRLTRGCHNASLCNATGIALFREDIGRHNAIDSIVGQCLLEGLNTNDCMILSTGRIASEIVQKVVRAGIPLIVSGAVATDMAVAAAKRLGLALVGNAKAETLWIYNNNGILRLPNSDVTSAGRC